jgi:hypothetical protein
LGWPLLVEKQIPCGNDKTKKQRQSQGLKLLALSEVCDRQLQYLVFAGEKY